MHFALSRDKIKSDFSRTGPQTLNMYLTVVIDRSYRCFITCSIQNLIDVSLRVLYRIL